MLKRVKVTATKDLDRIFIRKIIDEINLIYSSGGDLSPLLKEKEMAICEFTKKRYPVEEIVGSIECLARDFPILFLTDLDIYYADLDYVYGFTDPERRVSVVSLARLKRGASTKKIFERAVKTAIHEIGHLNDLRHCKNRRCVMFLSFGFKDTDRKDKWFCDKCLEKLLANSAGGTNEARNSC